MISQVAVTCQQGVISDADSAATGGDGFDGGKSSKLAGYGLTGGANFIGDTLLGDDEQSMRIGMLADIPRHAHMERLQGDFRQGVHQALDGARKGMYNQGLNGFFAMK